MVHYVAKEIQLPSRGKLYQNTKLGENQGKVIVYPITLKTQKSLLIENPQDFKLSLLLDSCTNLNELEFDYKDLLVADEYAIFVTIRQLTYGNIIEDMIQCINCKSMTPFRIDLLTLDCKNWDGNVSSNFTVNIGNVVLVFRYLYVKDQDQLFSSLLQIQTQPQNLFEVLLKSYALRLVSIDNKSVSYDEAYEFFSTLPVSQLNQIDEVLEKNACGYDLVVKVNCLNCKKENPINILLGLDFFRFGEIGRFTTKIGGNILS